jgi:hypothetical protein
MLGKDTPLPWGKKGRRIIGAAHDIKQSTSKACSSRTDNECQRWGIGRGTSTRTWTKNRLVNLTRLPFDGQEERRTAEGEDRLQTKAIHKMHIIYDNGFIMDDLVSTTQAKGR